MSVVDGGTSAACASDRACYAQDIPDECRSVLRAGVAAEWRSRSRLSEGPGTIWPSTPGPRPLRLLVG